MFDVHLFQIGVGRGGGRRIRVRLDHRQPVLPRPRVVVGQAPDRAALHQRVGVGRLQPQCAVDVLARAGQVFQKTPRAGA